MQIGNAIDIPKWRKTLKIMVYKNKKNKKNKDTIALKILVKVYVVFISLYDVTYTIKWVIPINIFLDFSE